MNGILLISFYDSVALGARLIMSTLKSFGVECHLILFKSERTAIIESPKENAKYYQIKVGSNLIGCGEDINPSTIQELRLIKEYACRVKPRLIGISGRTPTLDISQRIVELLRPELPNTLFIGGGYGPTWEPEKFLKFLDFVVLGEGETPIREIISSDPYRVAGVAWLANGRLQYNQPPHPIDLDRLPYPDRESNTIYMIEDDAIVQAANTGPSYDIFGSRGCPSRCTYCLACQWDNKLKEYGIKYPRWRQRSIDSVIDELSFALEKYHISFVRFKDSIFSVNKDWLFKFMEEFNKKINLDFHCFLDERFIDDDIIVLLKNSGLSHTTVGIQSISEKVRAKIMGRHISDNRLIKYAWQLNDKSIPIKYDLIGWNPFETENDLRKGLDFLRQFPKGVISVVYQLKIFPRTPLWYLSQRYRPVYMEIEKYEKWATLYQMVLHSYYMEQIALKLVDSQISSKELNVIFQEEISKYDDGYRVYIRRKISRGEKLKIPDIEFVKAVGTGLKRQDVEKILHRTIRFDLDNGTKLDWNHFFGSYEKLDGLTPLKVENHQK
jgi:radical SAM superfamily enzyme YgiQ (UPF0313 family)